MRSPAGSPAGARSKFPGNGSCACTCPPEAELSALCATSGRPVHGLRRHGPGCRSSHGASTWCCAPNPAACSFCSGSGWAGDSAVRMTERLTGEHRSAYAGTGPAAEGTPAVRPAMQAGPGSRIPGLERIPGHAPGPLELDRDAERSTGERRPASAAARARRPKGRLPSHTCNAGWAGRTNSERRGARAMRHGQRAAEAEPGLSASGEAPTSAACASERRSPAAKVPQRVLGPWTAVP